MFEFTRAQPRPDADATLVSACLKGDESAWHSLVEKYKRLVYAIPLRDGLSVEDAEDIFQSVWTDVVLELPRLRDPAALPHWLTRATVHKCIKHRLQRTRRPHDPIEPAEDLLMSADAPPDALLREAEQQQQLREAIDTLPPRCRELVQMLFFETPVRPYKEIAASLGLAQGSIGFIRGRCLARLKAALGRLQT